MSVAIGDLFNDRPHPGPLPRGEGESFSASPIYRRLDLRSDLSIKGVRSITVPSLRGEGQGEGGRYPIQSEPPYKSK